MNGNQASEGGVPHGQLWVTLCGFSARVVWKISLYTSPIAFTESCGDL